MRSPTIQRSRSAVGAPRGRRANADVDGGVCTETSLSPWRCHCVSTVSWRRVFGACTVCALSVIVSIAFSRRLYGVATATIALPRRSYCVHRGLQGDDTAIPLRCEQSQQNCIKAAWSLYKSSLIIAGLFLAYMQVQQVQDNANVVHLIQRRRRRMAPRRRRVWVRQWLDVDRRLQYGHYHRLMCELRYEDPSSYFNLLRVPPNMFDELLESLGPLITKQDTPYWKALEPGLKLAMPMRHLASGVRYASMEFDFRVPHNTMSVCVRKVRGVQGRVHPVSTTEAEWRVISEAFGRRWKCPMHAPRLMGNM